MLPTSNGDRTACADDPVPALTVTVGPNRSVNWYSFSAGGTLLQANSISYIPSGPGIFYAEAYATDAPSCTSSRTGVTFTIEDEPTYTFSEADKVCGSSNTTYELTFQSNAASVSANAGMLNNIGSNTYQVVDIPLGQNLVLTLNNQFVKE